MTSIISIIPARSGSKGVPGKNIAELGGYPLIAYSIAASKLAGVDRVIVSTDSGEYAEIATRFGAEVPFIRPAELSNDQSTDYEFMLHAMNWMHENEVEVPEYWLHLRPTTPMRDPVIIKAAIDLFVQIHDASSLRSGHIAPETPFKWFMKDSMGYFKGLREDLTPERVNLPRQKFPPVYMPNGYIDIVKASHVLNSSTLHGEKMLVFETPPAAEIDTAEDFDYVDYQMKKGTSPLFEYMAGKIS